MEHAQPRQQRIEGPSTFGGPIDRVTFFEEQARHRRVARWYSFICAAAVFIAGVPLTLILTPLLFTLLMVVLTLLRLVTPVPEAVWAVAEWLPKTVISTIDGLDRPGQGLPVGQLVLLLLGIALPSVAFMGLLWLALLRLFARSGVGGVLLQLGVREPRPGDLEERQLVNLVEEMALAAGLPAPRVKLLDGAVANAAAVGSGPADATVVVSRRLLDEMDRDETQGVLSHLIASVGNGDLGLAMTIVTVQRTFALVLALVDATVSSSARALLWRLLRFGLLGGRDADADREATLVTDLLAARSESTDMEDVDRSIGDSDAPVGWPRSLPELLTRARVYATLPVWASAGMAKVTVMLLTSFVLGPLIALLWRRRRRLADATAVQLSRNPDGLAAALFGLAARGGMIAGGEWAVPLFIVGPAAVGVDPAARRAEMERLRASGGYRAAAAHMVGEAETQRRANSRAMFGHDTGFGAFHPSIASRLARLRAMGANVDQPQPGPLPRSYGLATLVWILIVPLLVLGGWLTLIAIGLMVGLISFFMMMYLLVVTMFFGAINGRHVI